MATTLEELVRNELAACVPLTTYLGIVTPNPTTIAYPHAGAEPGAGTATPYIVIALGAEAGDWFVNSAFTLWIYDSPTERYWRVEDIVNIVRRHFEGRMLAATVAGATHYGRVRHNTTSPRLADDEWDKVFRSVRFDVWGLT